MKSIQRFLLSVSLILLIGGCASVDSEAPQTPRTQLPDHRWQDQTGQPQPMAQGDVETLAEELFQSGVAADRVEARRMAQIHYIIEFSIGDSGRAA
jgi:PBP1b-binding outer membrane lipoprotein LpoB